MKKVNIDLSEIYDKSSLYIYLKDIFKDYEFYGSNLDALMDVLMCLNDVEIKVIYNKKILFNSLNDYSYKLIDCFNLANKENEKIDVIIEEV